MQEFITDFYIYTLSGLRQCTYKHNIVQTILDINHWMQLYQNSK